MADALASGTIGLDAAAAIVGALAPIRERGGALQDDAFAAAEEALVDAATGAGEALAAGADEVAIMAKTWALYLDPDGTLPDEERALRARGLTMGRERGGIVRLNGSLLPEVAAQLERLFDAFLSPKANNPGPRFEPPSGPQSDNDGSADNERVFGGDDDVPADPRTTPQRRHDAFAGILAIAAGMNGMPQLGGAPPTLVVTVAVDQLDQSPGVAYVPAGNADDTGAVPASVARHIGCAGAIQRMVFDTRGRLIELGSPQRIYTGHQRRAIATRDGTCITPGCHVPAAWCEIHHVEAAARGGPTHTDNGVLLCWFHHRTLETSGWEIRMVHGAPWIRAPRWLDSSGRWRPTAGSANRQLTALGAGSP